MKISTSTLAPSGNCSDRGAFIGHSSAEVSIAIVPIPPGQPQGYSSGVRYVYSQNWLETHELPGIRHVRLLPGPWDRSFQRDVVAVGLRRMPGGRPRACDRASCSLRVLWRQRELQDLPLFGLRRVGSCTQARRPDRCLSRVRRPSGRRVQRARLSSLSRPGLSPRQNGANRMTNLIKTSRDIATSLSGSAFRRVSVDGRTRLLRAIQTWGGAVGLRSLHRPPRRAAWGPRGPFDPRASSMQARTLTRASSHSALEFNHGHRRHTLCHPLDSLLHSRRRAGTSAR